MEIAILNQDNYEKIYKEYKVNYEMEIVLMNDDAIIPTRASKGSAGLDLYSNVDVDIDINSIKKVNTGICISLPENTYGSIDLLKINLF